MCRERKPAEMPRTARELLAIAEQTIANLQLQIQQQQQHIEQLLQAAQPFPPPTIAQATTITAGLTSTNPVVAQTNTASTSTLASQQLVPEQSSPPFQRIPQQRSPSTRRQQRQARTHRQQQRQAPTRRQQQRESVPTQRRPLRRNSPGLARPRVRILLSESESD